MGNSANPATAHETPKPPNAVNTDGHPRAAMTPPASAKPNALPQLKAAKTVESATLFLSRGTYAATAAAAAGTAHPLAAPNSARAATRVATGNGDAALAGTAATATLQSAKPSSNTRTPPRASAATPPTTWVAP